MLNAGFNVQSKTFAGIEDITAMSIGVFGNAFVIPNKLKALVRYDMYNTGFNDATLITGDTAWESNGGLLVIGADYFAHKKVHIIPNIQITSYEKSDKDSQVSAYINVYFKI